MITHFNHAVNSNNLTKELAWLETCINFRVAESLEGAKFSLNDFHAPDLEIEGSSYAAFVYDNQLSSSERLTLMLSLTPHLQCNPLSKLHFSNASGKVDNSASVVRSEEYKGVLPTGFTAVYLCAGSEMATAIECESFFDIGHLFASKGVLYLDTPSPREPELSGLLQISRDWKEQFLYGKFRKPTFSTEFPAKEITTELEPADLVLAPQTWSKIETLLEWLKHKDTLFSMPEYRKHAKRGNRTLFHGSPGTGKTITAALLGKLTGQSVYRVDLSMVVSKYIGETEKNLGKLFDKAESKGWILFFDEADALFSKRSTDVKSSNDRHANQEVAFLLQRIEDYDGLVILGTNFANNIDEAFKRRFDFIIPFYMPGQELMMEIWKKVFPKEYTLGNDIDLFEITSFYDLSPSHITNIMKYVMIKAKTGEATEISRPMLLAGIKEEMEKIGKAFVDPQNLPHVKKAEKPVPVKEVTMESSMQVVKEKNISVTPVFTSDQVFPPGYNAESYARLQEEIQKQIQEKEEAFNSKFR